MVGVYFLIALFSENGNVLDAKANPNLADHICLRTYITYNMVKHRVREKYDVKTISALCHFVYLRADIQFP